MNIFVLDRDPQNAVTMMCDKRGQDDRRDSPDAMHSGTE
jgi:hypothetical protein